MSRVKVIEDVPDDVVDQIVGDFESEGCEAVKEKQSNGLWTVTATCPDAAPT